MEYAVRFRWRFGDCPNLVIAQSNMPWLTAITASALANERRAIRS